MKLFHSIASLFK